MISIAIFAVIFCLTVVEGNADMQRTLDCIKGKMVKDLGSNYTEEFNKLKSTTAASRPKKALEEYWKKQKVIKVAKDGQMTINKEKCEQMMKHKDMKRKDMGKAMEFCMSSPDADRMRKEAARMTQCVFGEMKKKCQPK